MSAPLDPYYEWLGIQPKYQPPNHYRLLGIELFEPSPDVIQRAADRQMAHLRTFQTGPHSALSQQLLNEVAAARVCLLKPDKREAYDADLRAQLLQVQDQPATTPCRAQPTLSLPVLAAIGGTVGLVLAIGMMLLLFSGEEPSPEPVAVVASSESSPQPAPATTEPPAPPQIPPSTSSREAAPSLKAAPEPVTAPGPGVSAPAEKPGPSATERAAEPGDNPVASGKPPVAIQGREEATPMESTEEPATPPLAKPAPPRQKAPAPSTELQQSLLRQVCQAFGVDQAKTTEARLGLARQMLAKAAESATKPEERFALFWQAGKLAAEAGDADLMDQCVGQMEEAFQADALQIKKELYKIMADAATDAKRVGSLLLATDSLVDEALAEGRLDVVQELSSVLGKVATRPAAKDFRKQISQIRDRLGRLTRYADDLRKAEDTLRQTPDDGPAHLTLGQWFCLLMDDWDQGLPHLEKCSDETLKTIAQAERRAASADQQSMAGKELATIGDRWWDYGQKAAADFRDPAKRRAGFWYQQAVEGMDSGPQRTTVEKRLASIERPAGAARERSLPKTETNSIGMKLILIPSGQFVMGASPDDIERAVKYCRDHYVPGARSRTEEHLRTEGPQRQVTIRDAFYLGSTEVTQEQYQSVMGTNPSNFAKADDAKTLPVENVTWNDATEFCRRLSAMPAERLHGRTYRLPCEAEWEYACRAGTTADISMHAMGRAYSEMAWINLKPGTTRPVGTKKANPWGLYDMLGNVAEWCSNRVTDNRFLQLPPPRPGKSTDEPRSYRGGSWRDSSLSCRPTWLSSAAADTRRSSLGFRVAMTPRP